MARRTPNSKKTPSSKREPGNQSEGVSAIFDGLLEGEISIGWERSGIGLEITISPSTIELTLGIGVASVTLDLGELNNSSVSYAFDIYEIKGKREGSNVRLDYYIGGQLVKSENRTIPECEPKKKDSEGKEEEPDIEDFPKIKDPPLPRQNYGNFIVARVGKTVYKGGLDYYQSQRRDEGFAAGKGNVKLKKIIHRNDENPDLRTAAYVFEAEKSEQRVNYTTDSTDSTNQKVDYVLFVRSPDGPFLDKLLSLGYPLSHILYTSSHQFSWFFPYLTEAPILSTAARISLGSSLGGLIKRVRAGHDGYGSAFDGWSLNETITRGDNSLTVSWTYKFLLEEYLDPPPSEPPIMIGKKRCCAKMKDCCRDIERLEKKIDQIHKALAVKEVLNNGLEVPNRLVTPNGKGLKKLKNYLEISSWQMRIQDHLGIHPFKASISDANAAKAGNQKVEAQFVSGTAAMRKIVELLLENKGDGAVRLNLMVRSAIIQAQILNAVTIAAQSIKSVASFIGMPIKEKLSYIKMPFDVSLGARKAKGFDPKKTSQAIKVNTEAATEEILPKFLQSAEQPYTYEGYDGKQPSLIENIKGMGRKSQKQ